MPLRTACTSCGKKLQVRDELAGKRVKCPGCATIFVASANGASTGVKAAPAKTSPAAPSKDKVSAKPMAKRPAPPPLDDDDEPEQRPVRSKARVDDDDDDEGDERPVRPRGKKSKKAAAGSSLLWLWLALGGVLLIGGGVGAYFVFFNGPSNTGPIVQNKGNQAVVVNQVPDGKAEALPLPAGNATDPGGAVALADLVPGDAWMFMSVSGEAWNAKALEQLKPLFGKTVEDEFQKAFGFPLADLERVSIFTVASLDLAKKSSVGPVVVPVVVMAQAKKPFNQQLVAGLIKSGELGKNKNMAVEFVNDRTLVTSLQPLVQMFKDMRGKIKATGTLERALAQAGQSKGALVFVKVPPEALQEATQQLKNAPPFFAPFLKTKAVLASLDLTDRLQLSATLVMDDAAAVKEAKDAAEKLKGLASEMLDQFGKDPQAAQLVNMGKQALNDLKITTQDKELTVAIQADFGVLMALALPAIEKVKGAATTTGDMNNLKQIGLAWHNYHQVYQSLPPQTVGKGLSWRVAILPFMEQDQLFKQFKLDEPWNSAHNKKLIPLMPRIYEAASRPAQKGMTFYQTFVGPSTINKNPAQGMKFQQITDGTSNTIIVAEAEVPVEWTKPADISVAPNVPIGLGASNPKGTLAIFADGSVRYIPRGVAQQTLRLLIDPADGKQIPKF